VTVDAPAKAVAVHVPWRRHDENPERKAVLVCGADEAAVPNVLISHLSGASADVVFEAKTAGDYFLYYLPQVDPAAANNRDAHEGHIERKGQYRVLQDTADPAWVASVKEGSTAQAKVAEFQARTAFDSFYPMEVCANSEELASLRKRHPQPFLLFPEDRDHPIRLTKTIPLRWAQSGPREHFEAKVFRGEFYVFQVGVYSQAEIQSTAAPISVHFEVLAGPGEQVIGADAFECFSTSGIDTAGKSFQKQVSSVPGGVVALWCGVQIPVEAKPGPYHGAVHLNIGAEATQQSMALALEFTVQKDFTPDGGLDQPQRLARLKWLNSKVGLEETVTAPYTPLQVDGKTVRCLGRAVTFDERGLPSSVKAGEHEMLAEPISLTAVETGVAVRWKSKSRLVSATDARAAFESNSESEPYQLRIQTSMEFDGGIGFDVSLTAKSARAVSNIVLNVPFPKAAVPYAVGMGLKGGARPASWKWAWSEQPQRWKDQGSNLEYFVWLGSTDAGLFCRLKAPLDDWMNGSSGSVHLTDEEDGRVSLRVETGARELRADQELHLSFRLLPTPLKPQSRGHWNERYAHSYRPIEEVMAAGATVLNIHHNTLPNLYINYPFLNLDLLGPYIRKAQANGIKAKIYYTVRELTTHLPELWAFRSLGDEIYRTSGTQGHGNSQLDFWLQEHLTDGYAPAWITRTPAGDIDAAIRVFFNSRLDNFYLEGLQWLLKNVPIDGLYLDEVGYSREMMQRVRRVLETRAGAMIDLHGNHDWWSCNCPIGYYMEHLPYVDRLWLGEAFHPDSPPDFWLIEMSGIPFGLSSDMLEAPHVWRGMLFGMSHRAFYTGVSPKPVWELWDRFGIQDSETIGWWEARCPVRTGRNDVLATVYRKPGKTLVAIASWVASATDVQLSIDWKALGLDPAKAILNAPEMAGLQPAQTFKVDEAIMVPANKGWLLQLS
jgi:hypothetical protein